MKCSTCHCELNEKNEPVAALDFGLDFDDDLRYYCSAECLVKWILGFAEVRFGKKEVEKNEMQPL